MKKEIALKVPATIANVVCGFDILGMAVNEPFDEVRVRRTEQPGITIHHEDDFGLPCDPEKNVAGVALRAMMNNMPQPPGFEVSIKKHIMPGSGLGSSAASSVGAVAAANRLIDAPFAAEKLLEFAAEGERLASGASHYDNIAPALFGGITFMNPQHKVKVVNIAHPPLWCTIVHPQIEVKTADSRRIIKKEIPVTTAIHQWSNIAGLITGLFRHDFELIAQSLEDLIFEPARSILIPGFAEIKNRSKEAGALGGGISGSGPSVFMLSKDQQTAQLVENEMKILYNRIGLNYKTYVTTIKNSALI